MKPRTVVQLTGLAALVAVAGIQALDGVRPEVTVLLVAGILAIAAPDAYDRLLDQWGGG